MPDVTPRVKLQSLNDLVEINHAFMLAVRGIDSRLIARIRYPVCRVYFATERPAAWEWGTTDIAVVFSGVAHYTNRDHDSGNDLNLSVWHNVDILNFYDDGPEVAIDCMRAQLKFGYRDVAIYRADRDDI